MKKPLFLLSLLTAAVALTGNPAHAALTIAPGDLLMGFYQVNSSGTGVAANTYVYNLGGASGYREGGSGQGVFANIGADLTTAFGAGWSSDGTVRVGVVGAVGSTDALTNGDPARTVYFSQGFGAAPGDSTALTLSSSQRGSASTALKSFAEAMVGADVNGAVDGGSIYSAGDPGSFASFLPPTVTTHFGVGASPLTSMTGDTVGLDVYRVLHSTTGADLTAAYSAGDALVGSGQYIGSFTLATNGDIGFAGANAVPEPSTGLLAGLGALFLSIRRRRKSA
ncbi:MAG: PEP-CTERM sorting domain-containing protein [Verrucomicrobiales bacterium]